MEKQFDTLKATRSNVLKAIEGLSLDQLNKVPSGFRNNIVWNVAHMVVTQQLLCYKLSGLEMDLDAAMIDRYKKGSKVDFNVEEEEWNLIKAQLIALPNQLVKDYNDKLFHNFSEYSTSYNVTLSSIEDAIHFNNVHEGLHLGYIMAMKKMI